MDIKWVDWWVFNSDDDYSGPGYGRMGLYFKEIGAADSPCWTWSLLVLIFCLNSLARVTCLIFLGLLQSGIPFHTT